MSRARRTVIMRRQIDTKVYCRTFAAALTAVLSLAQPARSDGSETITATARVKTAGGAEASAPVSVIVERFSTDKERDELAAAIKQGGTRARDLLQTRSPIGTIRVGGTNTAIKHAYERTT